MIVRSVLSSVESEVEFVTFFFLDAWNTPCAVNAHLGQRDGCNG